MSELIAALPMYDWLERRAEVDAEWAAIRDALRASGIGAPERLTRRNADMPAVPGGIRGRSGEVIAPDPATLPPDELDLATLWRHPKLLLGQACWGPMQVTGLAGAVTVLGQPDYSDVPGGRDTLYSSAVVMRRSGGSDVEPPQNDRAFLPLERIKGQRFAYSDPHSWSGRLGLGCDLAEVGRGWSDLGRQIETGAHRASVRAVADGRADFAIIDCRSWVLAKQYEPAAADLEVAGWTSRQTGLPFISAAGLRDCHAHIRRALRPLEQVTRCA